MKETNEHVRFEYKMVDEGQTNDNLGVAIFDLDSEHLYPNPWDLEIFVEQAGGWWCHLASLPIIFQAPPGWLDHSLPAHSSIQPMLTQIASLLLEPLSSQRTDKTSSYIFPRWTQFSCYSFSLFKFQQKFRSCPMPAAFFCAIWKLLKIPNPSGNCAPK